ncbi:hypothetical protein [uncultured Campylobacter sp.]|nr:hypothetical protein [uncultured Campylobacter sp.]
MEAIAVLKPPKNGYDTKNDNRSCKSIKSTTTSKEAQEKIHNLSFKI